MNNTPTRPREVDGTAVGKDCVVQWVKETVQIPKQLFELEEDLEVELQGITIVPFKDGKMEAEIIYTNAMDMLLKAGLTVEQIKALHSAG